MFGHIARTYEDRLSNYPWCRVRRAYGESDEELDEETMAERK